MNDKLTVWRLKEIDGKSTFQTFHKKWHLIKTDMAKEK